MAKNQRCTFSAFTLSTLAVGATLLLSGCSNGNDEPDDTGADTQPVATIGVQLSAPGLISGTNPDNVSGVEVDLASALGQQLEIMSDTDEVTWQPTNASKATEPLQSGEMQLLIGQFSESDLTEEIAWIGPYVTVEPGLLVRTAPTVDDEATDEFIATNTVTSLADLEEASVCVVSGSLADSVDLPADQLTTQQTVSECETGMRSGRYDAVAADDVQLGGVLADSSQANDYDVLLWSDLIEDDAETPNESVSPEHYWIGTTPEQCDAAAAALTELISNGTVEERFGQWNETTNFQPELVEADEVTTRYCDQ